MVRLPHQGRFRSGLPRRGRSHRRGFTILELVAVFIVLGVLAALTITMFSRSQASIRETNAAASIQAVVAAQLPVLGSYSKFTPHPGDLTALPRDITVVVGVSTAPRMVSMVVGDDGMLALAASPEAGVCVTATVPNDSVAAPATTVTAASPCNAVGLLESGVTAIADVSVLP